MEVYTILSLAKNKLIRSSVSLSQIDFGSLAFEINKDSLEGSGPKRERAEVDFKTDEPQLETQVVLPSALSLEDFVVPSNVGTLEKKAFFAASPHPSAIIFDYLFFGSNSRIINANNPKYLVYRVIEFPTQNYAGYALPQSDAVYQGQTAYEFASKPSVQYGTSPQAIGRHYILPLIKPSEFLRGEFAYQTHEQALLKGYDFSAAKPTTIYGLKPVTQSTNPAYDMPRGIDIQNSNFWQSSSYFVGPYKPVVTSLAPNQAKKEIPRQTLDFIVARAPKTELPPFRLTYAITLPVQMPAKPAKRSGVESIAQASFVYSKQNQQTSYNETSKPNYDAPQQSINIMSSGFWRNSSYYKGEYQADGRQALKYSPEKSNGNRVYRRRRKKNDEKYEVKNPAIKKARHSKKETKQKLKPKINVKQQRTDNLKENKDGEHLKEKNGQFGQKEGYHSFGKQSFAYVSALLSVISPIAKTIGYFASNKISNSKFKNEHSAFIANYENWRNRAEKELGVKIYDFFMDTKNKSSYGHNENVIVPSASLNKIGIGEALVSMLQEGRLDIHKEVPHIPELVLDRETRKYKQFGKDGDKSHKLTDLNVLMEKFSCNGATNHILYALGLEGDYKENPTLAEIKKQVDRGMQIVMDYANRKGIHIKMETPYIDEPKLRVLGYNKDWNSNTTTAKDISLLMASTQTDSHLSEEYQRMWVEPLEQEETMQWFKNILGVEVEPIKPGIDKHNNGFVLHLKGKVLTIILDKHPDPIYDNPDNKSEIHNRTTPQGKKTFNYLAELGTILHNHLVNPIQKKTYKPIFLEVFKPIQQTNYKAA